MAETLGEKLLEETLEEGEDEKLTELAEKINTQANDSRDEEDEASSRDNKKSRRVA